MNINVERTLDEKLAKDCTKQDKYNYLKSCINSIPENQYTNDKALVTIDGVSVVVTRKFVKVVDEIFKIYDYDIVENTTTTLKRTH